MFLHLYKISLKIFIFTDSISAKPAGFLQIWKNSFHYHKDKKFANVAVFEKILLLSQGHLSRKYNVRRINPTNLLLTNPLNYPNTTHFDVFENLFLSYPELMPDRGTDFKIAFIIQANIDKTCPWFKKFSFPLNHANRTVFDLFWKISEKQKRPWPQTEDRRFLVRLAWQSRSTRLFRRIFNSRRSAPDDYFRWSLFPQSENISYFRDMKRPRLFVLLFYHITFQFATNAAVNKPQQTTTPVDSLAHFSSFRYFYEIFSYLSAWGWWENGLVCQRRAAILEAKKGTDKKQNSCASLWGRPLTDCALLSLFSGAPKGTEMSCKSNEMS